MFTGIVTAQAVLREKKRKGIQRRLIFELLGKRYRFRLGESLAMDGVCVTVSAFRGNKFSVDLIPETLHSTTLDKISVGQRVNVEHPLRVGDPLGGHWVTGHVEGVGFIRRIEQQGESRCLHIEAPADIIRLLIKKGSIAVDGVSFTVQERANRSFVIGVTPHTYRVAGLGRKRVGDSVNLESDIFAKWARHFASNGDTSLLTERALRSEGF